VYFRGGACACPLGGGKTFSVLIFNVKNRYGNLEHF